MKYLILANLQAFNICNQIAGGYYEYPNSVGTQRYADPIHHPDGVQVALPLFEVDDTELLWDKYREVFGKEAVIVDKLPDDWYTTNIVQASLEINLKTQLNNLTKKIL